MSQMIFGNPDTIAIEIGELVCYRVRMFGHFHFGPNSIQADCTGAATMSRLKFKISVAETGREKAGPLAFWSAIVPPIVGVPYGMGYSCFME